MFIPYPSDRSRDIGERVEAFVRQVVVPYERDPRCLGHEPEADLVLELREKARAEGLMTPHIFADGQHMTQLETAAVLQRSGLSPLGPVALNTMAPDEGNMYLLGKVATEAQKRHFLDKLVSGRARSAFFMTEPWDKGGAGSDPSMLQTTAVQDGDDWVINGRKIFITGAHGAEVGIVMARTGTGDRVQATMFLVDLPHPQIHLDKVVHTIDNSMPGGHALVTLRDLRVPSANVLGEIHEGFRYAQVRLSPARLSHCMRWLGSAVRAHEIACDYAVQRQAFGKLLIDHEGVGFKLVDNQIDLHQAALLIAWCAGELDTGSLATTESSLTKASVAEALFRVADRCVQVMGGAGLSQGSVVEQVFRETRAFRVYDGPTEVHKWSLAKKIKHATLDRRAAQGAG
ncbi:acyl-CoA dehydrogenase family protein [Castellaniella sp.]|uniref:acyl-CoA dehydrogenase family protein n=1 Tax=Castellaniella sp. TaxID=1955812 RepID=UPI003565CF6E